jgi:hypothetical protein
MAETVTIERRVEAIARCAKCAWWASLTGHTPAEVEAALRAQLRDHVRREHQPVPESAS